jgi:predicted permease
MLKELQIAFRRLAARPTFALTAIATLAIGVGATTAIFSTVNATLLRPLPYARADDIYTLNTAFADGRWSSGRVAGAYVYEIAASAPSVEATVAVRNEESVILRENGENRQALFHGVSEGFFELFGVPVAVGRAFESTDYAPDFAVGVVSHRVWTELLGADSSIVGRSLQLATGPITVVGVAAPEFDVPQGTDVWYSMPVPQNGTGHNYQAYLRVRPGTTPEVLASELATVMSGIDEQYHATAGGRMFVVRPLLTAIVGDLGPILLLVLGGAVVLLLIACANVATLLLARGAAATREVAVRAALGAGRWSIVRPFLVESSLLALIGTTLGLLIAWVGVQVLLGYGTAGLPRLEEVPFDGRVLLFAGTALVTTTLLTGLLPALRLAKPDIRGLLNESGRSNSRARGTNRLLSGLVVAEIAFAIALVSGAGWLLRSYVNISRTDPGFDPQGRLVFTAFLLGTRWAQAPVFVIGPDGRQTIQPAETDPDTWLRAIAERLESSGQVQTVGSANVLPLGRDWDAAQNVAVPGDPYDPEHQETARLRRVSADFFTAIGSRLLAGRSFADADGFDVAVVNEAFVRRYLGAHDPLTTSFGWGFPTPNLDQLVTIVGVVEDMKYASLREAAEPTFYMPGFLVRQSVVVATTLADPRALIPTVRDEVAAVDPSVPVTVQALEDIVADQMVRHRIGLGLMALFAALSLGLAAVGIYGVIAHVTGQRTGELATRMAFGATPADIRSLVLRQGRALAVSGAACGLGGAVVGGAVAANRLHEVRALDPAILTTAVSAVMGITLLAFLVPAMRAARRQPMRGLGAE